MPIRHPLPQLSPQRINRVRSEVAGAIWKTVAQVPVQGSAVLEEPIAVAAAERLRFTTVEPGSHFGPIKGGWKQRWFRLQVEAPPRGATRHLFWRCQGETTAYHRGQPWAGLDVAHASCPVPPGGGRLLLDCGTYQTAIWAANRELGEHGLRFDGAHLADRDEAAFTAHHDLEALGRLLDHLLARAGWKAGAPWDLKPDLPRASPLLRRLLTGLAGAAEAWDAGGIPALQKALTALRRDLPAESWQPHATLVGHSHLDLVWMWPEHEGERKGAHTIATLLRLMDRYPEYTVTWTQPALIDALRRRAPGLVKQVERQVRAGRWEFTGGMEVEAENQIPCGEALARSLAYGQRHLAALRGGKPATVLWLPDCFGFAGCLPQLMVQAGLKAFFTGKLSWSQVTPFPHTTWVWRGIDGSEVLAHQAPGGGDATVGGLAAAAEADRQSDVAGGFLAFVGIGDGGGGTTETEIERARRAADLAQVPRTRWGRAEDFFARLDASRLPVMQGELYLEYHRGTYTTQSDFKAAYRGLERALQAHEAALALTGGKALGHEGWKRLLFAQFHDALPGSSIQLVYQEMTTELRRLAADHRTAAARRIQGRGTGWTVLNPVPQAACAVVDLGRGVPLHLVDGAGAVVPTQKSGRRTLVLMHLPPAGTAVVKPAPAGTARMRCGDIAADPRHLDNGRVRARFDAAGRLHAMTVDGHPMPLVGPAGFVLYHDHPANFDAWDIDREDLLTGREIGKGLDLRVEATGPLRSVLVGQAAISATSRLTVRYILEAGSPWLQVEAEVDWHEAARFLKYRVPTACRGRLARFGTPFGSILRPQLPGHPQDEAMWEVPGNRWAAVLDDAQHDGVAMISEAKYGWSCREGTLALTLLRAPVDSSEARPERVDQGRHALRFAIGRHRDGGADGTAAAADRIFADLVVAPGAAAPRQDLSLSDLGTLVPTWMAPAEDGRGRILRLHETAGCSGTAKLRLDAPRARVEIVDLLERRQGILPKAGRGGWRIRYTPYQVISLRLG